MYFELPIPTPLLSKIEDIIDLEFNNPKESKRHKLIKLLFSVWYFIYDKQINSIKNEGNLTQFVNINSTEFEKFEIQINNKKYIYSFFVKLLEENSLLEINHTFMYSGEDFTKTTNKTCFPKSYKVRYKCNGDYTSYKIDFDLIFSKPNSKETWLKKYPKFKNNISNSYMLDVDIEGFVSYASDKANYNTPLKSKYNKSIGSIEKRFLDDAYINEAVNQLVKIRLKNLWFSIAESGRLYSSISNLHSQAVPFLTINGNSLVSLDVANMQPLLLSMVINDPQFRIDCENGEFYDKIKPILDISRNDVKLMMYRHVFFNKRGFTSLSGNKPLYEALEYVYPGLIASINTLKKQLRTVSKKQTLAGELQKQEASIFVDGLKNIGNRFYVTRHDEVLCFAKDESFFTTKLLKLFADRNLKVTIDKEEYKPKKY